MNVIATGMSKWHAAGEWFYQWTLRYLPPGLVARSMEAFIGVLCTFVGIGIFTRLSQPPAAEQFLDDQLYGIWAGALVSGGIALLVGVLSIRWVKPPLIFFISRVAVYRLGLRLLSLATLLYAIAQISYGGVNAIPASLFTFYFSATCTVRLLTIGREV
jgi:hypothetical protein